MLPDEDPEVLAHTPNVSCSRCYPLQVHYGWLKAPIIKHNRQKNPKNHILATQHNTQHTAYIIQLHVAVAVAGVGVVVVVLVAAAFLTTLLVVVVVVVLVLCVCSWFLIAC